jgi:cell division protease FtsH
MGGRAAEDLIFSTATSGAENDLKQVRKMARKMVLDWGMSDQFENIALGGDNGQVFLGEELSKSREYSEETAREVDVAVRKILDNAFQRAMDTITENRDQLDALADELLKYEEVSGERVVALLKGEIDKEELVPEDAETGETNSDDAEASTSDAPTNGRGEEQNAVPTDEETPDESPSENGHHAPDPAERRDDS